MRRHLPDHPAMPHAGEMQSALIHPPAQRPSALRA